MVRGVDSKDLLKVLPDNGVGREHLPAARHLLGNSNGGTLTQPHDTRRPALCTRA